LCFCVFVLFVVRFVYGFGCLVCDFFVAFIFLFFFLGEAGRPSSVCFGFFIYVLYFYWVVSFDTFCLNVWFFVGFIIYFSINGY
jgi:hypothetical protein